jgi:hypothetical protein
LLGVAALLIAQLSAGPAAAQAPASPPPPPPEVGYPPPTGYPPPPRQRFDSEYGRTRSTQVRRPKALLIAGPIVLGASYGFTALVGLELVSGNVQKPGEVCTNCNSIGSRLLIPIIGPWLALPDANGSNGKALTAVLGLAQATGLVLTIVGISRYKSAVDATAAAGNVTFAFVPSQGGGLGLLGGRF